MPGVARQESMLARREADNVSAAQVDQASQRRLSLLELVNVNPLTVLTCLTR